MKDLRDLKDLTIHDVQPIREEGRGTRCSPAANPKSQTFFFFITLQPRVESYKSL